jgi:hypothetical protein
MLRKGDGMLALGDKSKPQEIYDRLGLSKKVFKEALGHLYKMHMVELGDTTVKILPENQWRTNIPKPASEAKASSKDAKAAKIEASKKAGKEDKMVTKDQMDLGMPRVDPRESDTTKSRVQSQRGAKEAQMRQIDQQNRKQAAREVEDDDDDDDEDDGADVLLDAVRSREEVMARLEADAAEAKEMARKRLEAKREKDRQKQLKRIEKERENLDPEIVEKRKKLLESMPAPSARYACMYVCCLDV